MSRAQSLEHSLITHLQPRVLMLAGSSQSTIPMRGDMLNPGGGCG